MKSIALVLILISITHIDLSGQWEIVNEDNIDTTDYIKLLDVCFIDKEKGFVLGGEFMLHHSWGKVFMTDDGGISWNEVLSTSDDQCPVFCHFTDRNTGYIGSYGVGIKGTPRTYQTLDGGINWLKNSLPAYNVFFVNDSIAYALGDIYVYNSTDGGESWVRILDNTTCTSITGNSCLINSVFFTDNGTGWLVGEEGLILKHTGFETWEHIPSGTMLPLNRVFFTDKETGFVTGGYSNDDGFMPIMLRTEDGGKNWTNLPAADFLIHDLYFENTLHGWAVGENNQQAGILIETTDGGENWILQLESLKGALRAIYFSDNTGWAVGDNAQILKLIISDPVQDIGDNDQLPEYLTLYQNLPNPFRSKTLISYYLSVTGDVDLGVYDMFGRKISTLLNERQLPGRYEVEWDAANKKAGIYLCILESSCSKRIMKMILLK